MKRRCRTSGGELAYVDEGAGPAVLLLPGFPSSSYLWRAFVPPLAARHRVIAPDLLGYGDSDKPQDVSLTITAQAGYIRELLEILGVQRFAVAGHDIGGGVAQLLALDAAATALILFDSIAFDVWPIEGVRMLQQTGTDQETADLVRDVIGLTLDLGMAKEDRRSDEVVEAYAAPFVRDPGAFFRAARAIDGNGLSARVDEIAALDVPVFVVWGEEDPFLPVEVADRLNEILSGSTLALLPGCSHFVTEDASETLVPLVAEWLRVQYLHEPHGHEPPRPLFELGPRP
jgi:pimeloyl-ACP methyl ester carboxylesterase